MYQSAFEIYLTILFHNVLFRFKANRNILRLYRFHSSHQPFDPVSTIGNMPFPAPIIG